MKTRIADDPDSWGKPEDLERRNALREDVMREYRKTLEYLRPFDGPLGEPKMPLVETSDLRAVVRQHFLGQSGYSLCPHCGAIPNHERRDMCRGNAA